MDQLEVCLVGGRTIVLEPPVTLSDTVDELRRRSAQHLDIHPSMLVLLRDGAELLDGNSLDHCAGASRTMITAIIQPCRAKPEEYESYILPCQACLQGNPAQSKLLFHEDLVQRGPGRAFMKLHHVKFPEPKGININMMPFIVTQKGSIPEEYHSYWPLIEECRGLKLGRWGDRALIGYLTIQEGNVPQGQTQRRAGLLVETPGSMKTARASCNRKCYLGAGMVNGHDIHGGMYMASNVAGSCKIWHARLRDPEHIVGHLGNIEHLRDLLGEGCQLEAGELIWLTDTTPHEALPVEQDCYRQFFRVVSFDAVSKWYESDSTKNRLGIVPDPSITTIIKGDKFEHAEGDGGSKDDGIENAEGNDV